MAAESDEINQAVNEIAERVRRRIIAARVGKEEPCTAVSPSAEPRRADGPSPAPASKDCAPSCTTCENFDSCGVAGAVRQGVARISPDRVRTSADIAPFIDHPLLKPEATRE